MSAKLLKLIIPGALVILLVACAQPVYNVNNSPINASITNYDLSDVTKAIKRAGTQFGWEMSEPTPGHIVATLRLRTHVAVVDITYTLDDFSINYNNSSNLIYDPSNNTIHKNYNGWIQNLSKGIDTQLALL